MTRSALASAGVCEEKRKYDPEKFLHMNQNIKPQPRRCLMPITYRAARAGDLQEAGELVVHSLNELCERHGFDPIATVRPPIFSQFSLRDDPKGLWLAEEADQILGFAFSWVCGDLWFLAVIRIPGPPGPRHRPGAYEVDIQACHQRESGG
jgi:hypothetical protein